MKKTIRFRHLGAAVTLLALIGSLAPGGVGAQPKKGGKLVYAYLSGPGTLDPYMSASAVELEVIHHLFESLVAMAGDYETKPMLAASVESSADARTFIFKLAYRRDRAAQ